MVGGLKAGYSAAARHTERPSPASSVHSGTARAIIEVTGSGPKYRPSRLSGAVGFIRKISPGKVCGNRSSGAAGDRDDHGSAPRRSRHDRS